MLTKFKVPGIARINDEYERINYDEFLREYCSDRTTTPKGVAPRVFIREANYFKIDGELLSEREFSIDLIQRIDQSLMDRDQHEFRDELFDRYELQHPNIDQALKASHEAGIEVHPDSCKAYEVRTWGAVPNMGGSALICVHETEEEAEYHLLTIWEKGLLEAEEIAVEWFPDDDSLVDSEKHLIAEDYDIDIEVAESIARKRIRVHDLKMKKKSAETDWRRHRQELEKSEAETLAEKIEHVPEESYNETCQRLSEFLGKNIRGAVFHRAVKIIRKHKSK